MLIEQKGNLIAIFSFQILISKLKNTKRAYYNIIFNLAIVFGGVY